MSYELDVISHLPEFKGRKFKKHYMNGMNNIGVFGNEPFEIVFKNNSYQKVQVKLSIDGTDILTGKLADTTPSGEMWMVNPYSTLSVKAWPETNKKGAQFVFTSADKSVATNTHGNLSSRGIIAAAVFIEGYHPNYLWSGYNTLGGIDYGYRDSWSSGGFVKYNDNTGSFGNITYGATSLSLSDQLSCSTNCSANFLSGTQNQTKSLEGLNSLASVGAGKTVEQKIEKVAGLVKPQLSQTLNLRYQWWTELCEEAKAAGVYPGCGNGFPGDKEVPLMSLGNTPRLDNDYFVPVRNPVVEFNRF